MDMLHNVEHEAFERRKSERHMNSVGNLVVSLGDFNGHVGGDVDGFYGIHEGHGAAISEFRRNPMTS